MPLKNNQSVDTMKLNVTKALSKLKLFRNKPRSKSANNVPTLDLSKTTIPSASDEEGDSVQFSSEHFQEKSSLFELRENVLSAADVDALRSYAENGLGEDPSSKHFMRRKKSIVYALVVRGQVFALQTNYFLQAASYNDFSGGYKRFYETMPETLVQNHLAEFVLSFHRKFQLPDGAIILLQLQQSVKEASSCTNSSSDVTGQGIHTDGADVASIVCIERSNVRGGENSLYDDLEGKTPLLDPTVLQPGDGLYFQDNSLYHYVSDIEPEELNKNVTRTVLIAHYPADIYLAGDPNPRNKLDRKDASLKLREVEL